MGVSLEEQSPRFLEVRAGVQEPARFLGEGRTDSDTPNGGVTLADGPRRLYAGFTDQERKRRDPFVKYK